MNSVVGLTGLVYRLARQKSQLSGNLLKTNNQEHVDSDSLVVIIA